MVLGVPVESGIHREFYQMLSDRDVPIAIGDGVVWNNNFFFDSTRRVYLSAATKNKSEIGWRLRVSSKDFLMYRYALRVVDVNDEEWLLSEVWNGFEKIIIILYIVEIWNHMTWEVDSKFMKPTVSNKYYEMLSAMMVVSVEPIATISHQ